MTVPTSGRGYLVGIARCRACGHRTTLMAYAPAMDLRNCSPGECDECGAPEGEAVDCWYPGRLFPDADALVAFDHACQQLGLTRTRGHH